MYETLNKFSERSGLSYHALRKMCLKKELPFINVGNRRMICVEEAETILANRARGVVNEETV